MPRDALLEVSQQQRKWSASVVTAAVPAVELYMIRTPRHRPALFLPRSSLELCAATESNRFRRFIRRMTRNRNSVIRWVGRVTRGGYRYYQKLEDRIDPLERMIKALNCPRSLRILHAPSSNPELQFRDLLRAQIIKHTAWLIVDGALTTVAVMFFWVLVPIPGPNVLFYYPALRLASHYRAMTGARRALHSIEIQFDALSNLARVEEDLRNRSIGLDADDCVTGVEGLGVFLKRLV